MEANVSRASISMMHSGRTASLAIRKKASAKNAEDRNMDNNVHIFPQNEAKWLVKGSTSKAAKRIHFRISVQCAETVGLTVRNGYACH